MSISNMTIKKLTRRQEWIHNGLLGLIGLSCLAFAWTFYQSVAKAQTADADAVHAAFVERFTDTTPDEINCDGFGPLCQVIAGKTVLYVDPGAEHAFIGRLYDLEEKRDLTEEALKRVRPSGTASVRTTGRTGGLYDNPRFVNIEAIPLDAAIVHNPGAPLKVTVFSDLNCGFCSEFARAFKGVDDIEVSELLVGRINSRQASLAIGCAEDPAAALETYWARRIVPDASCDRDIVTPAQLASTRIGSRGTPTFVRSDGAMVSGFQSMDELRAWLSETPETILASTED